MDPIAQFLDFTGTDDDSVAKQYLEVTGNDVEYAVTLFMESGGQAPGGGGGSNGGNDNDDESLAQRLQQEAYGNDEVRQADANVHRHEQLVDDFLFGGMPLSRPTDIFGSGRVGIFNQRFDDDESEYYQNRFEEVSDDEDYDMEYQGDDEVVELNSDGEVIEQPQPQSRRRRNRSNRLNELTSTQRRLANLFRPPFDIMEKFDIDNAKTLGRQQKKWILINIQDSSEFACQVLNRDFWSNSLVKDKVRESFVFLQYQNNSPNGQTYVNFYSSEKLPHIAILDPLTGERVYKFTEGEVPNVEEWLEEVDDFLSKFSLSPNSNNPIVKHEAKFDPDALTEEQQIEYAMKQSVRDNGTEEDPIDVDDDVDNKDNQQKSEPEPEPKSEPKSEPLDTFESIPPQDYTVNESSPSTRVQIRFPSGQRLIHKFNLDAKVVELYQWLKFVLSQQDYGIGSEERFSITNTSNRAIKLIESLDMTMEDAGLKSASILLEKE